MVILWSGQQVWLNGQNSLKCPNWPSCSPFKFHLQFQLYKSKAMKNITLIIGGTLLVVNLIIGLLLSVYPLFNMCFTSMVIISTTLLLYLLCKIKMNDGFVIGLYSFFSFMGFIEMILGIISQDSLRDNGYLVAVVILIALQGIALTICNMVSKNI